MDFLILEGCFVAAVAHRFAYLCHCQKSRKCLIPNFHSHCAKFYASKSRIYGEMKLAGSRGLPSADGGRGPGPFDVRFGMAGCARESGEQSEGESAQRKGNVVAQLRF